MSAWSGLIDRADRLEPGSVVAGREPRDHAFQGDLAEQVLCGEASVGLKLDLPGSVEVAGARPGDRRLAAAEHDAARLGAVACRGALGAVLALGSDDVVEFLVP